MARAKKTWTGGLICDYCGGAVAVKQKFHKGTKTVTTRVPPPPGARDLGKTKTETIKVEIFGRAICEGCGARFREVIISESQIGPHKWTWISVSEEEYNNDYYDGGYYQCTP